MHSLFFDVKRAHWSVVKWMNPMLARVEKGLTQARHDVLHAMELAKGASVLQSDLWKRLGVHPSTMCKLLRSMRERGFVRRTRAGDRRQWQIELTEMGRGVLVRAKRFLGKFVNRTVNAALRKLHSKDLVAMRMEMEGHVRDFRRGFGDRSTLLYEPGWPPFA